MCDTDTYFFEHRFYLNNGFFLSHSLLTSTRLLCVFFVCVIECTYSRHHIYYLQPNEIVTFFRPKCTPSTNTHTYLHPHHHKQHNLLHHSAITTVPLFLKLLPHPPTHTNRCKGKEELRSVKVNTLPPTRSTPPHLRCTRHQTMGTSKWAVIRLLV